MPSAPSGPTFDDQVLPDAGPTPAPVQPPKGGRRAFDTLWVFAVGIILALLLRAFVVQLYQIPTSSMAPTIKPGDRIVVEKISKRFGPPERGDIVVFKRPDVAICNFAEDAPAVLIKRVVGLPGESISVSGGSITVDGQVLDEEYLAEDVVTRAREQPLPMVLGDEEFLMLGDNRPNSQDGLCFGPIAQDDMVGKALIRIWPPSEVRLW